uniref:Uncharacterized protein n=1 Tax=Trichobilharzia regenti TaxID=157069 RepID=A0AA85IX76_TRIRE|nr:unnamed protein product [Trichobilharzia regenti]
MFTILEGLLMIIIFFMRRRLKIIVAIVLAVLSMICAVFLVVLTFIPWYEDLCKMMAGGFLNTSMCLLDSPPYFWYKYGIFSVDIGSPKFAGQP